MSFTDSTRNLTVIARNAADGFYYAGFITKGITNEEEFHHVTFYNIRPQDVLPNDVINIGGAVPWPTLKIGDYVLVAVRCRTSGLQCYMPGRVVCLPIDLRRENRFYTLKLYSGRTTTKPRRYIIKIGQDKFNEITDYISNIRYKQPKMFVSEPDLRGRLLARRHKEDTNNRKRLIKKRICSAEICRRRRHCHHHYHHLYHHYDQVRNITSENESSRHTSLSQPDVNDTSTQTDGGESTDTTTSFRPPRKPTPIKPTPRKPTPEPPSSDSSVGRRRPDRPGRLHLRCNTVVLARWSEDGWYYFGKVTCVENDYVKVLDSTGYEENIRKRDILVESVSHNGSVKQDDKVVAMHPKYENSYAPATILNVYNNGYLIQFYDETETETDEVYKISHQKYTQDVDYIKSQEMQIRGLVIARDDVNGVYRPFIAVCPNHMTQQIFLQAQNNTYIIQEAIHVFRRQGSMQKITRHWKYVLGPLDPARTVYLPAEIITRRPFRLRFCNGQLNDHAKLSDCFFLSEDYYNNATKYFVAHGSNTRTTYMF